LIDLFSSVISYVLSGLKIYLAEKHLKQVQEQEQKTKGPFVTTEILPVVGSL